MLGLGTVGMGVVEILDDRSDALTNLLGDTLVLKKILVQNMQKKREASIERTCLTTDFNDLLEDEEIEIIVEVTSNVEDSYQYIKQALNKGKSVVTANKALVSKYFEELSALATEKNVSFLYEASVGGGIPILKPLKEEVILNTITEVSGILNGTSNYILTKMFDEGLGYEEALKEAQDLGYAEADPTADVAGFDTRSKLRILGTLALQGKITEQDIIRVGIDKLNAFDVRQIQQLGSTVKLIGEVKEEAEGYTAVVMPTIIREEAYLATVNMAYNSVSFTGSHIGELKFYGAGAGKQVTGDAVLRDVVDIALGLNRKQNPLGTKELCNLNHTYSSRFYIRVTDCAKDRLDALNKWFDQVTQVDGHAVVVTGDRYYSQVLEALSSLGIDEHDYCIVRLAE